MKISTLRFFNTITMTNLQKIKEKLPFDYFLKVKSGYSLNGIVFIDNFFLEYKLMNNDKGYKFDMDDLTHLEELLNTSEYPKLLPENYHLENNKGKFSDSDLYFLVAGENIKIGLSTDVDMRIESLKTSIPCDFDVYYIPRKGFLEKTMHHAFGDFHKKGEWFSYNSRFEKFIKENALRVNQSEKEITPYIKPYVLGFGAYNGYEIKEVIELDKKYCRDLIEYNILPSKIIRFIKCNI